MSQVSYLCTTCKQIIRTAPARNAQRDYFRRSCSKQARIAAACAMQGVRQLALSKCLLSACTRSFVGNSTAAFAPVVHDLQVSSSYGKDLSLPPVAAALARLFATGTGPGAEPTHSREYSNAGTSTSQARPDDDGDYLEEWAKLIEKNDTPGQAELLTRIFGENPEPQGPPLSELLNYNRREEERAKRRMFELQKQEEIRQSRQADSADTFTTHLFINFD